LGIPSYTSEKVIIPKEMRTDLHLTDSFLSFPTSIPPKELAAARNDLNSKRHSPSPQILKFPERTHSVTVPNMENRRND
jgi:hypothetical protein